MCTGVMGSKKASWGRLSLSWILKKATEVSKWALQDHMCVFKRSHWCNVKVENRVREETENDSGDWIRGRSLSKHLLKGRTRFFFYLTWKIRWIYSEFCMFPFVTRKFHHLDWLKLTLWENCVAGGQEGIEIWRKKEGGRRIWFVE